MVELWTMLPYYAGAWPDDLRIFDWTAVPDPTTFGRWLWQAGPTLIPVLDELPWGI